MRQIMMRRIWTEGYRTEPLNPATRSEEFSLKVWTVGWSLAFAVAMTLLTVYGPQLAYSKQPADPPPATQSASNCAK